MYAVNGVYYATQRGIEALSKSEPLLLPNCCNTDEKHCNSQSGGNPEAKKKQIVRVAIF